jgi:hypothetical protein
VVTGVVVLGTAFKAVKVSDWVFTMISVVNVGVDEPAQPERSTPKKMMDRNRLIRKKKTFM